MLLWCIAHYCMSSLKIGPSHVMPTLHIIPYGILYLIYLCILVWWCEVSTFFLVYRDQQLVKFYSIYYFSSWQNYLLLTLTQLFQCTPQQNIWFIETQSVVTVQTNFLREYGTVAPSDKMNSSMVKRVQRNWKHKQGHILKYTKIENKLEKITF